MSCSKHNTCELYFPIPRNGKEKDFIIYFNPNNSEQKSVMRCEIFEDNYNCSKVPGFDWEKLNSTHGLITVPQYIAAESGRFRSQVQGQSGASSWRCSWSPVDSCSAYPTTTSETDNSATHARNDTELKQDNNGNQVNIGLVVGATLAVLAVIIIVIIVLRRFKGSSDAKPQQTNKSLSGAGNTNDSRRQRNSFWRRFKERDSLLDHKQGCKCSEKSAEKNPDSEEECRNPDLENMSSLDDVCLRQSCAPEVTPHDNTLATNQTSACFSALPTAEPDGFPTSSDCEVQFRVKTIRDDGASSLKDIANEKGILRRDDKSTSSRNDADFGKPGTSANSLELLTNSTDGQNRFGERESLLVQKQGHECSEMSAEKNPERKEECRYANWEEMSSQGNVWLKETCQTEVIVHDNNLGTNQTRDDGASSLKDIANEKGILRRDDKSTSSRNDADFGKPGTSANSLEPLTNSTDSQNRFGERESLLVQKQGHECSEMSAEKNPERKEECRYAHWEEMSSQGNVWLKGICLAEDIEDNTLVTNQTRDDGASGLEDYNDNEIGKTCRDDKSKSSCKDADS